MHIKKKLDNIVSYIIICLSSLFFSLLSSTTAIGKIFKIKDIEISEPFSASFNKDKVINKAFDNAFQELSSTIITTKDRSKLKNLKLNDIKYLIESFEINDENFLNNKYIANFNVNFNKKKTLNFFEKKNIFPSLKREKDFLTILIFIDNNNNQIFLYENNPFYKNWNNKQKKYFLINYVLLDEDLEDLKLINENKENIENYKFERIIRKYDLEDYIISIFFRNKKELRILSKFSFDNSLKIINQKYFDTDLNDQETIDNLVFETKLQLEDLWKNNNLINTSLKLPINLQINSEKTLELTNFEKAIDLIDLVYDYYITSISNKTINYKIIFNGSPRQFLKIMEEKNIKINIENETWKVQ